VTAHLRLERDTARTWLFAVVSTAVLGAVALNPAPVGATTTSPSALAVLGTLRADDLPAGWIAGTTPQKAAEPIPAIAQCDSLRELQSHAVAYGHSARLYEGSVGDANNYISESVTVYPSTAFAQRAVARRVSGPVRTCHGEAGVAYIKSRLPSAQVTWQTERQRAPETGDRSALVMTTTKVVDPKVNVTFYSQYELVQVGRAVVALNVATEGAPKWSALRTRLARLLAHRLAHRDSATA
jgi:hypothetical protein